jgi:hypothetical protein
MVKYSQITRNLIRVTIPILVFFRRKWLIHDYDLKGQLYAGDAAVMLDKLRTIPIFYEIIDTHRKVG